MKRTYIMALLLSAAISLSGTTLAQTFMTVNGQQISQKEFDDTVKFYIQSGGNKLQDTPALRDQIKDMMVARLVITQEALKRKLDQQDAFKKRMENFRIELLRDWLIADIAQKVAVDDAAVKARYEKLQAETMGAKELNLSQIVLKTEDEAKETIAELKKGANFEKLLSRSIDSNAPKTKGSLGWVSSARLDASLGEELKGMKKGQFASIPLKTSVGFHVIRLDDSRPATLPSFDDIKPQLAKQLQDEAVSKTLADLKNQATIK